MFIAGSAVGVPDIRAAAGSDSSPRARKGTPGLTYRTIRKRKPAQRIQILKVDPSTRLTIDVALGTGDIPGVERTSSIARRHHAVAAINATVGLPWGRPMGLFAQDGALKTSPLVWGRAFAISRDERSVYMDHPKLVMKARDPSSGVVLDVGAWNEQTPRDGEIAAYTPSGGRAVKPPTRACSVRIRKAGELRWSKGRDALTRTYRVERAMCARNRMARKGGIVLASKNGTRSARNLSTLRPGTRLELLWGTGWRGVTDAVAGNPTLIENGRITAYNCDVSFCKRQPRTGVGVKRNGDLLLITVDGRRPKYSVGMTLVQFARLFKKLGAVSAINLDGGGSTTMFLKGRGVMNRPSDPGGERLVSSAVLVLPRADRGEPTPGPYTPPPPGPQPEPSPTPDIPPIPPELPDIPPDFARFVTPPSLAEQREAGRLALADPGSTGGYVEALLAGALGTPPPPPSPVLERLVERFDDLSSSVDLAPQGSVDPFGLP
ncbi:MAG: phosphodiester glycosidase family protein [Actinomycetota bacterium]